MRGEFRGVQALIQSEYQRKHICKLSLHLRLEDAFNAVSLRRCFIAFSEKFFNASAFEVKYEKTKILTAFLFLLVYTQYFHMKRNII